MSVAPLSVADAASLQECIALGGVALIPTDTVYGLACDPASAEAVERLYALKGRPPRKPSAVLFFDLEQALGQLDGLPEQTAQAVRRLLPGPVTLLLPNPSRMFPLACDPARESEGESAQLGEREVEPAPLGESGGESAPHGEREVEAAPLGVRVPDWPPALASLRRVQTPVLQSSANLSGGRDPRSLQEVPEAIRSAVDLTLDGGPLGGVPSTVVDLGEYERHGSWRVLREGALAADEVSRSLARAGSR